MKNANSMLYAVAVTNLFDNETKIEFHCAVSEVEALSMHSELSWSTFDPKEDLEEILEQLFNSDIVAGVKEVPLE